MTIEPATQSESRISASTLLLAKLAAVRRKHVAVAAGTGAAMAVGAFVILIAISMLLDWWLDFPMGMRVITLVGTLLVVGYIVWKFILTPLRNQPDDDTVALAVERHFPQFRSRLISSIQFPRPHVIPAGAASSLARMTILETETLAAPMDFTDVVQTKELQKIGMWSVAVLALGLFAFMYGGEVSRDLLKRAFLSSTPVPRHTRVELVGGDRIVGRGDAVKIEAFARGVVPKQGKLVVKSSGIRTMEYWMEKDKEGRFARTLENVQQTFTYTVQLNDGVTKSHVVTVVPRPSAANVVCEQIYPAYTKLPNAKRPLGDLTLLAGSKLRIAATATTNVTKAFIRLAGLSNDIPMQVDTKNTRELRGEFAVPSKGLTGFSIEMTDTGGMESRESAVYRIDVVPDRAPKVKITYPDRKEELVTRYASLPVGFEASDDFAITKARLRYKIGESENAENRTIELQLPDVAASRFTGVTITNYYNWMIRDLQPPVTEGTRIEYWLELEDNNDVTGPGIGVTEHQLIRVVSKEEKQADLLNRAGDFLGTINDVTGDQEKLNLRLGELILERRTP